VFSARDGSGADLSAVRVTMDGDVIAERLEGTALSVDPGKHSFTFETPGQAAVVKDLVIAEGHKGRRELVTFGMSFRPTDAATSRAWGLGAPSDSGIGTQRILSLVAGSIGVAGIAVGTAFGVAALSKKTAAENICPNDCATPDGVNRWSDAVATGNVATVALVVGAVGLAGGALLWLTAPRATPSSPRIGVSLGGLRLKESW
jgi:hypothetical protein